MTRTVNKELAFIDSGTDRIVIDCLVSDEHSFEMEVSEYPIESGANITDNIRPKNPVITIQAVVSNTPIRDTSSDPVRTEAPAADAYAKLMKIREDRVLVTVRTSLKTYENMALKNLSINRNAQNADALEFSATFQQAKIVTNKRTTRVAIPAAKRGGTSTKTPTPNKLVERKVDPYDGTWFDPDINGWREGATFDEKKGHWEFFKGRPLGQDEHSWQSGVRSPDNVLKQKNEAGLIPLDKKTGKVNKNLGQQFQLITDPASIDAARAAGTVDDLVP